MRNSRTEFWALLSFLVIATLVVSNFFTGRIFAEDTDVYRTVHPIATALDEVLKNYVEEPDSDAIVEGALTGMMNALDEHSSFLTQEDFLNLTEDTEGEFDGIGVIIKRTPEGEAIEVQQPFPDSPAMKAGVEGGDLILKVDGESTKGLSLPEVARLIKGPRGSSVELVLYRKHENDPARDPEVLTVHVRRDRIPLESVVESRVLEGGVGYIRINEFRKTTGDEIRQSISELQAEGMKSLILDLRWNPGGLLNASEEVVDLFLPKDRLVVYTKGRASSNTPRDDMRLSTNKDPILPTNFPLVILTNEFTASSSEIVTGALQHWKRALVVGETTYGKGSVQTIIRLRRPENSALRLTTALYYTPADVTIHKSGIRPDVHAPMSQEDQRALLSQMARSREEDYIGTRDAQDHGAVTGEAVAEDSDRVNDTQLQKAVELLRAEPVFDNLIAQHHLDTSETQVAARGEDEEAEGQALTELEAIEEQAAQKDPVEKLRDQIKQREEARERIERDIERLEVMLEEMKEEQSPGDASQEAPAPAAEPVPQAQ